MKAKPRFLKIILAVIIIASVISCRKSVPSDKTLYIGTWTSNNGNTEKTIGIQNNGKATYDETTESTSGATTKSKSKTINGHIKFTSNGFKITNSIFSEKISVSQEPKLVENSSTRYSAVFNGETYYR